MQTQNASSLDATPKVQDLVFPVTIELDRRSILVDGQEVPLEAGMTASIDIKTADRRVIDYLLAPLRGVISQAAHER
jgi:multidrug efflux pump subunit AcrA (membrane-fusion protein)